MISWIQVRVADPTFLGYFIDKGVAAAAKVVRKVRTYIIVFFFFAFFLKITVILLQEGKVKQKQV